MRDVRHDSVSAVNDVLDCPTVVRDEIRIERNVAVGVTCSRIPDNT